MLDRLNLLILEEKCLKRSLDVSYNRDNRTKILTRLKEVQQGIKETKIKLQMERSLKKI